MPRCTPRQDRDTEYAISSLVTRFPRIRLADPSIAPSYKYVPGVPRTR